MGLLFTLDDVDAAYASTGMKPSQGEWGDEDNHCGCVLSALIEAKHGRAVACSINQKIHEYKFAAGLLGITKQQVISITAGFDGQFFQEGLADEAYEFGRAAWDRVKHLATPTTTTTD
jgi:hypothetical protein